MAAPQPLGSMSVKVYVVVLPHNLHKVGEKTATILAVKLTRKSAQDIVDRTAGAYIEKVIADKV